MVLRLRPPPHPRRPGLPDAERAGRVHPREPGDPGPQEALGSRRDRCADGPLHPAWPTRHCSIGNGPEFVAEAVQRWVTAVGARTAFIEPGSPWENGYIESVSARFRNELLDGEIFYSIREAKIVIEQWRVHYNATHLHSSLGYRPPAPETIVPPSWPPGSAPLHRPSSLAAQPPMH